MACGLVVLLQTGQKAQTSRQWPSEAPQQAALLARGVHWGHLQAMGVDPRLVVEEGGALLMAMAERPAVESSQAVEKQTLSYLPSAVTPMSMTLKLVGAWCKEVN